MALHAHRLLVLVSITAVIACGGDGGGTAPGQQLATVGRLERGSTIRLVARGGAAAGDSVVSNVTVTPAVAGAVSGVTVTLLQSGSVTLSARSSDGRTLSTTFDVAVPPTVYFDAVASGNRDIYSVSLDGRDLTRRTTSPADDAQPTAAAAAIVFVSTRDGNRELYSMPTAVGGGAEQRLTTTAANESQPAFAAGGAALAYVSDAGGAPRAYVAPVPLANPARLTATTFGFAGSIEASPTWSPTRDRVAFVATANGSANLFIAPATAGTPAPVAGSGNGQTDVEPAWSPDGNRIAFASTRAGTTQIFLLDLRTGAFSQLTNDASSAGQPGWLPDGRLVFTRFDGSGSTLWWVDPSETASPTQIATAGVVQAAHATGAR